MKKRKELDALLTSNMANGKKNGKSKRPKEGHELLRLESDSNSSDNDELFLAPKKTVVRRPKPCQCCTMCVPLIMFILTMGCLVVTGGLIWMHFNLKQDLDDLREKLQKATIQLDTEASQGKTIMDLESRLQAISDVPGKVDIAANNIVAINGSFHVTVNDITGRIVELEKLKPRVDKLETNAPSTSVGGLEQTVADNGNKISDLETKTDDHQKSITSQNALIQQLKDEISTLQSQVAELQRSATVLPSPTPPPQPPVQPQTTKSTASSNSGGSTGDGPQLIAMSEEIKSIWNAVHDVNSTVAVLQSEHTDLASKVASIQDSLENITALPSSPTKSPTQPAAGQYDLSQMHADIELLKHECNGSSASLPPEVAPSQVQSSINSTLITSISDRLGSLEKRVDKLNPQDLNNNLLNENTTRGLQTLIENSLNKFKEENLADFNVLYDNVTALQTELALESAFQDEVGIRLQSHENVVKTLQNDCAVCQQMNEQAAGPPSTLSSSPPPPPSETQSSSVSHTSSGSEKPSSNPLPESEANLPTTSNDGSTADGQGTTSEPSTGQPNP